MCPHATAGRCCGSLQAACAGEFLCMCAICVLIPHVYILCVSVPPAHTTTLYTSPLCVCIYVLIYKSLCVRAARLSVYMSSYISLCVSVPLAYYYSICIFYYVCMYVSSHYCCTGVLILMLHFFFVVPAVLQAAGSCYVLAHTTATYVSAYSCYMCPHSTAICVRILKLYMCPHIHSSHICVGVRVLCRLACYRCGLTRALQVGAAWLEAGNCYVLANIRGGGEFGPGWHKMALKVLALGFRGLGFRV